MAKNGSGKMATNDLKEQLLAPRLRSKKIKVDVGGKKKEIEVREPTMKVRDEYLDRMDLDISGTTESGDEIVKIQGSVAKAQVWLTLACAYDPSTGERIFDAKDEKQLLNLPANSFVIDVARVAQEFMHDAKDESKN